MNKQAQRVEKALSLYHSPLYKKSHDEILAIEETENNVTITINSRELELLKNLVSDKIGAEHRTWYDITNDEVSDIYAMAHEMALSVLREDRLHRLLNKLNVENA